MRPLEAYQRLPKSVKRVSAAGLLTVGGTLGFAATAHATEQPTHPDRPTAIVKIHNVDASRTVQQYKKDTLATKDTKTRNAQTHTVVETHTRGNKLVETSKVENGFVKAQPQEHAKSYKEPVVEKVKYKKEEAKKTIQTSEKVVKTKSNVDTNKGHTIKTCQVTFFCTKSLNQTT